MTKTFFARPALTIVALMIAGSTVPALAQDDAGYRPTHETISLRGVDMTSEAGVAKLREQVRTAANRACQADGPTLNEMQHSKSCVKTAIADGYAQIDTLHQLALSGRVTNQSLAIMDKR